MQNMRENGEAAGINNSESLNTYTFNSLYDYEHFESNRYISITNELQRQIGRLQLLTTRDKRRA